MSVQGSGGVAATTHLGGLLVGYLYLQGGRGGFTAEIKYRYLKWKMNRMRRKFDVYSGGRSEKRTGTATSTERLTVNSSRFTVVIGFYCGCRFCSVLKPRVQPPSTGIVTPVTYDAAGDARNATTVAELLRLPIRPSGICRRSRLFDLAPASCLRAAPLASASSTTRSVRV